MKRRIVLECPRCAKTKEVEREPFDPKSATKAVVLCPECTDATLAHEPGTDYYDKHGKPVEWWIP